MSLKDIRQRALSCGDIVSLLSQPKSNILNNSDEEIEQQKERNRSNDSLISEYSISSLSKSCESLVSLGSKSCDNMQELLNESKDCKSPKIAPLKNNFLSIPISSKGRRRDRDINYEPLSKSPSISDILKKMTFLKLSPPAPSIGYDKDHDYFLHYD